MECDQKTWATSRLPKEMMGRRLSQAEAKRLLGSRHEGCVVYNAVGTIRNRGDNTNYRKLAEHKIATCPLPLQ